MNIGEIHGGTARNSVAKETEFHGTVRCYSDEMFAHLTDSIGRIIKVLKKPMDVELSGAVHHSIQLSSMIKSYLTMSHQLLH